MAKVKLSCQCTNPSGQCDHAKRAHKNDPTHALFATFPSETHAKLAGWWFDSRNGWICPECNGRELTQTELPFTAHAPTETEKAELEEYIETVNQFRLPK